MPRPPTFFMEILREHQSRLERITNRRVVPALRDLYEDIGNELDRKINMLVRGKRGQTMTAFEARQLRAQVRQAQVLLARNMSGALDETSREAQQEAVRGFVRDLTRLERKFRGAEIVLPIEEAARFSGIIDKTKTSLMRMHKDTMADYGARVVKKFENQISLSLATGETLDQTADRLMDSYTQEWWQAERIARTETAWAFNATHADAIESASEELADIRKQWREHVEDLTYEPLDDRVGVDSIAMHGQIAKPAGLFTMPPTAPHEDAKGNTDVPDSLVGKRFAAPPSRPNGREVLMPWRPHWGIPGWEWRGRRVPVTTIVSSTWVTVAP